MLLLKSLLLMLCACCMSCTQSERNMHVKNHGEQGAMDYYSFEIAGNKVGYYEQSNEHGILYSNARFSMGGEAMENPFWIKHAQGKVIAYAIEDGAYQAFNQDADVYPSSAINLLLTELADGATKTYRQFNEGAAAIKGTAVLTRNGNKIEEHVDGKLTRYFILADGEVVTYCWGAGVFSHKVASKELAIQGSLLE